MDAGLRLSLGSHLRAPAQQFRCGVEPGGLKVAEALASTSNGLWRHSNPAFFETKKGAQAAARAPEDVK
jgi:hypothetical protein